MPTRESRREDLERLSRGKNGMLTLQRMRQIASGQQPGDEPVLRPNDSLEQIIREILDYEFRPSARAGSVEQVVGNRS